MRVILAILFCTSWLFGQGNTGSILGTVTDQSGAVVPNVRVVVVNVKTGVPSSSRSDDLGNYILQFLIPGSYSVTAEAAGFKRTVRENVGLEMGRQLRVDVVLETGAPAESVTVTASVPLLETETGALSTTIENAQLTRLPLLGRGPRSLLLLTPGTVQGADGTVSQGGMVRKDPYYVDGSHNSLHVFGGVPIDPDPDTLQEFKVMTNSFSAEYGETSGAIMAATTKSGTNEFHGTLFEFLRNDKLNAGNFFTHERSILRTNTFGGSAGGPIWKNKTFYFMATQLQRTRGTSAFTNLTVPLAEFKRGDFSRLLGAQIGQDALGRPVGRNQVFDPATIRNVAVPGRADAIVRDPFPSNRIPQSRFSLAATKIQELYPLPSIDAPFANYTSAGVTEANRYTWHAKVDHNFSERDKLMARYSRYQSDEISPAAFPDPRAGGGGGAASGAPAITDNPSHQVVVNQVHIFGPRTMNDLHLSWWQTYPRRTPAGFGVVGTEDLGIRGMPNGREKLGTPQFSFTNFSTLGSEMGALWMELQNSYSIVNMTSLIRGRHNFRFGGEARKIRTDSFQPNPSNTSWTFSNVFTDQRTFAATGFDYASFLLGLPRTFSYRIMPGPFKPRSSIYALFLQDDIRVSRKLTLNIGLRWDAPLWFRESRDRSGVFDLDKGQYVQFGVDGFRRTPWNEDYWNFGPRFGFAYSPFGDARTIVRGGYGLFSMSTMGLGAGGYLELAPIFADASQARWDTVDQVTWKTTMDLIPYSPSEKTGRTAGNVTTYPADNSTSYMQQWNMTIGRTIGGVMLEAGYAGNRGVHLPYGFYNANAIPVHLAPQAAGRFIAPFVRYPNYGQNVAVRSFIGSSIYHSLQVKVERRFSRGIGFLAAYTWQKTIATGDLGYRDPLNNRDLDRGIETNSVPQRFTAAYTYELPFGVGRRWLTSGPLTYVLGGWGLNGITTIQSGNPLTPALSFNSCVCGAINRPNLAGDPALDRSERTLLRFFNPDAFSAPALYTIGNAGRSLFYGPGLLNFDLAISKRFYGFGERRNLEFRSEMYNVTNTPRFSDPNTTIGAANAGRITSASGVRQVQLALKFYW